MTTAPIEKATRDELIGMVNDLYDALESLSASFALKEGEIQRLREALGPFANQIRAVRDSEFGEATITVKVADLERATALARSERGEWMEWRGAGEQSEAAPSAARLKAIEDCAKVAHEASVELENRATNEPKQRIAATYQQRAAGASIVRDRIRALSDTPPRRGEPYDSRIEHLLTVVEAVEANDCVEMPKPVRDAVKRFRLPDIKG